MLKALIKKQLAELFSSIIGKKAAGAKGNKKSVLVLYILLFVYLFAVFGVMFFATSNMLFGAFAPLGLSWLAFSLMGIAATGFGVIGTVFLTNSVLYGAKDNELLLSMPIKPSHIIFSRIFSLYVMNFIYEATIMLPCFAAYIVRGNISFGVILSVPIILLILPLISLAISLVLGFLVALVSGRVGNKSLVTVVLSVAFIVVYFYVVMEMQNYMTMLVANGALIGEKIQAFVYPVYALGMAGTGSLLHLLIFTLCAAAIFAGICFIVCKSFIKLATMKKGGKKAVYREKAQKEQSVFGALLYKELAHFWASPTYLMNGGIGSVMMLIGAVVLVIKGGDLRALLALPEMAAIAKIVPLIACAAISVISSMNLITAPSVSLEGKNMWLLRSLPVPAWSILKSKLALHMLVSGVPAAILAVVCAVMLPMDIVCAVLLPVIAAVLNLIFACIGLAINLKLPNFDWTSEVVPIKQGLSVLLTMLSGMGTTMFFILVYVGLILVVLVNVPVVLFLIAILLACTAEAILLCYWLYKRGTKIFETF